MGRPIRAWQGLSIVTVMVGAFAGTQPVSLAQARQSPTTISLSGCLVEESEYAGDHGLALATNADRAITQLVFIPDEQSRPAAGSSGARPAAYALTGPNEQRFARNVHQQVFLEGTLERDRADASVPSRAVPAGQLTPDGTAGVTPDGSPAHEATDAASARRPDAQAVPPDGRAASTSELDRINVTGARVIGGECHIPRDRVAQPSPQASLQASPGRAAIPPVPRSDGSPSIVTLTGCLVRQASAAPAEFTLLAAPKDTRPSSSRSAVPGSLPSGSGSATIGTSGIAQATSPEAQAYRLSGVTGALAQYVGQRIEVTGSEASSGGDATTRVGGSPEPSGRTETPAPETAHPSAVQRTFVVTTSKPIGGVCQ